MVNLNDGSGLVETNEHDYLVEILEEIENEA